MTKALATKNVAAIMLAFAVVFSFAFATIAKADTVSDLQTQVQALLAQISSLQGGSSAATSGSCFTFTRNHSAGNTGGEVMQVQKFLNSHGAVIASTGAGSPGNESSYFGAKTKAAVVAWQKANGVSPASGYWGPLTRAAANAMCAGGSTTGGTTGGTTSGAGVTVTASTQPANSLAPKSASRVPFTTFTISNNSGAAVTINGVTVQRTGLAADAAFDSVVLVDSNGQQVGISRTFNSLHQATVGDTFTIPAGASMTYTVAGNMAADESSYSGQVASISVVAVNTSVPVAGVLPITGAQQTINNSLGIGSVTINTSSYDPAGAQTKSIGDTGVKFSAVRFTAGSAEDVKLYALRFRMNGSASASDLSNLSIVVNGTSYPATWSTDGRYVSASIPGGVLMAKGNSVDAYIQGDVTGGNASGRVVEFDIDKLSDVYAVGQTYGYGIVPTVAWTHSTQDTASTHGTRLVGSGTVAGQPWFQGSTITIQGGTGTTIQKATSVAAANIAVNVPNQDLGGFTTNFSGEPVTVQRMVFNVSTSSGASMLRNVTIVNSKGVTVAGPVDQAGTTLTFSDSVTIPVGVETYSLKGTVSTGATNGSTYAINFIPNSNWTNVTGQTTGNTVSLSGFTSTITMNTMTVQGLSLTIAAAATPASATIVAGGQSVLFANIQLDASASGEDVRLNSLPIRLTTGGASSLSYLTGCQLYDGSGNALNYGTNIVNSVASSTYNTFSLNNSFTVTKGSIATLALKCNVSSTAQGTYAFGTNSSDSVTVSGLTSGNSTTVNPSTAASGTMTIASGSLTMSTDASSPAYALAAGGTSGVTVGVFKFRPTAEAMTLQKVGVKLGNANVGDVSKLYFYNSSNTLLGTAIFTGSSQYATSTLATTLNLPADTDTLVTVKADLADIGVGQSGVEGDLVQVNPSSAEAIGAASGLTLRVGTTDTVAGVRAYNTFPTIAQDTLGSTGMADGRLLRFKVTADSHGNVGIGQFTFKVSTTSPAYVQNIQLFGFTDAAYSNGISSGASTGGQIGTTVAGVGSGNFVIAPSLTPVQVPAGSTYYFELRASVTSGTNASVLTTLVGDSNTAPTSGTVAFGGVSGSLIWSPNATGTAATTTGNDWTNGFSVPGLSSSGIFQSRNQ